MEIKFKPTTHHCICEDCGEPFTVTTMTGPTLICALCFAARVAALWALGDK
jgi:hypothetical protein